LCNDDADCGQVRQDGRRCEGFEQNGVDQILCIDPNSSCDNGCADQGADCYLGFCGQMRAGDQCDDRNGPYTVTHIGFCPDKFGRCRANGAVLDNPSWCGEGRYCQDAELDVWQGNQLTNISGAICMPETNGEQCNPNLVVNVDSHFPQGACPLGSTCVLVPWNDGEQWRCVYNGLCDPTSENPNCPREHVCDAQTRSNKVWCVDPNTPCNHNEGQSQCSDRTKCYADYCAQTDVDCDDAHQPVGACVRPEQRIDHPFANHADQCAEGLRYESQGNRICVDLRYRCDYDENCNGRPNGLRTCIEGFCGVNDACAAAWGASTFTGVCRRVEGSQCNSLRCDRDQECQQTEHQWGDNSLISAVCTAQDCENHDQCGDGMRCVNGECGFGGFCVDATDCAEGEGCEMGTGMGAYNCLATERTAIGGCVDGESVVAGFCLKVSASNLACRVPNQPVSGTCR